MPLTEEEAKKLEEEQKKKEEEQEKRVQETQETLRELTKSVAALVDGMSGLTKRVDEITETRSASRPSEDEFAQFGDLEVLSRKDFMDVILKKMEKVLEDKLDGVTKEVSTVKAERESDLVRNQIKQAEKDHPDFWEWREEMKELVQRNPSLTAEDAYILARASNAKKAKEIDAKYTKEDKREGEEKEKKGTPSFGGLTPTSGSTTDNDNLTKEDAAETAWRRVFGSDDAGELTKTK